MRLDVEIQENRGRGDMKYNVGSFPSHDFYYYIISCIHYGFINLLFHASSGTLNIL